MILLEPGNRILEETVKAIIIIDEDAKPDCPDVRLCDFDEISYHVHVDKDNLDKLFVSMKSPCYSQFEEKGGKDALQKHYAGLVVEPENGYDVTVSVDLKNIPDRPALVTNLSMIRCNVMGGLFEYYFNAILKGEQRENHKVDLRQDTTVYFLPAADKITIVFSVSFNEKVDRVIAKVFLQEFVDARRSLGSAPPCHWNEQPPAELKTFGITENKGNLGFITFNIMKNHIEGEKLVRCVRVLQSFRSYLQYHIKCSKTLFHSRMRARIKSLLQVLNRAKIEQEGDDKVKKTASGKTFKR